MDEGERRVGREERQFLTRVTMMDTEVEEREFLTRPGEVKSAVDNVSLFFYACIGISSLLSFMLGFSIGFSSPTTVARYAGSGGDADAAACVFHNGTLNQANSHMVRHSEKSAHCTRCIQKLSSYDFENVYSSTVTYAFPTI